MASAAKTLVEKLVKENAVVVFSKSYCPFCTKAKNLLVNKYAVFRAIELDLRDDGAAIQDYLKEKTNQSTVPNVFIGGKQVGGTLERFGQTRTVRQPFEALAAGRECVPAQTIRVEAALLILRYDTVREGHAMRKDTAVQGIKRYRNI
ncbi:hypothetical protein G7K_2520-t1 [Saitoella complicata NRRL Y-17804]|uniref:Glutaredoxin domain-containing protein n=1 Tax=Saitoella complicata (strain BCRC 22490 / CBS 7301 / JCM 7358 / NBRC 10748 / NRRL Y-17804) TaxID=698492 RepID=A0A0E9NER1_SAICN|nr:hypothetical protein G7K_2520-t1 [Saitoella complicata NRRL Y-17804]